MSKVTFNKNGNLAKLAAKLQKMNNQRVQTGYFKEQGEHPTSGLLYTELMRTHEYDYPVMKTMRNKISVDIKPHLIQTINLLIKQPNYSLEQFTDSIGKWFVDQAYDIFGNRGGNYLEVRNNPTPLIDTGALESNFAYKVSFIGKVVTL